MLPKLKGKFPSAAGVGWSTYLPLLDTFKKRACRFILHHYLGRFLKDQLTLDQLTIDLYNGTGSLHNVPIDIYSVNELLESQGIPIELVSGEISTITVSIPWANIFQKATKVEINGLQVAIKGQSAASDSMFLSESYFNSLTTSMRLAQQCFKDDGLNPPPSFSSNATGSDDFSPGGGAGDASTSTANDGGKSQGEALEFFAQAIETVLLKVKITLNDTKVRFEPSDPWSDSIEILLKQISFFDDSLAANDTGDHSAEEKETENEEESEEPNFMTANFCTKVLRICGVSLRHVPNSCNVNKAMTEVLTTEQMEEFGTKSFRSSKSVLIGNFLGKIEAKIKMKQNPQVSGSRLELECFLGSLSLFVQPKHIKVLIDVMNGFVNSSAPNSVQGTLNTKSGPSSDMFTTAHFESELHRRSSHPKHQFAGPSSSNFNLSSPEQRRSRHQPHNPSMMPYDDGQSLSGATSLMFHTVGGAASEIMGDEDFFSVYGDQSGDSMTSSMISGSTATANYTEYSERNKETSPGPHGPVTVNLRFSGVSLVLLHANADDFEELSNSFAQQVSNVTNPEFGFGSKDVFQQKKVINAACDLNHLTFLACPVNVRLISNQSRNSSKTNVLLTMAFVELSECLNAPSGKQVSTIVSFANQLKMSQNQLLQQPNLKLDVTFTQKFVKKNPNDPDKRLNVFVELEPALVNFDLTILDRLIEFFSPDQNNCNLDPKGATNCTGTFGGFIPQQDPVDILSDASTDVSTILEVRCASLDFTFYIPIPVFVSELEDFVTTQRLIRDEAFLFTFINTSLKVEFTHWSEDLDLNLECQEASVSLVSDKVNIKLCKLGSDKRPRPNVSFKLFPFQCGLSSQLPFDMNSASLYDSFPCDFTLDSKHSGPFSSKVVFHNSQPLVKCGTYEELRKFSEDCMSNSRLSLKISLPEISIMIPNKVVFDLVYNRFSNDLLLWEPLFSKREPVDLSLENEDAKIGLGLASQSAAISRSKQHFSMCKSGIRSAYGSHAFDSLGTPDDLDDSLTSEDTLGDNGSNGKSQNWMSVNLKFGTINLALSDIDPKSESVTFQSFADLKSGNLFAVVGYSGSSDCNYLTFSCFDGQYHHNDEEAYCKPFRVDKDLKVSFPAYMDLKLRKSRIELLEEKDSFTNPVINVAVKINANRAENYKHIKVAVNAEGVTLLQRLDQKKWLSDFVDFFTPRDELIPGYDFLPVVTELHITLANCAILYRPLHLPYTVLFNTGSIYISSNVVAGSSSSIFQIILESSSLWLSCTRSMKHSLADYAKIVDTGVVSLNVLSQMPEEHASNKDDRHDGLKKGKTEIRLSCDIFNLYTCVDSLKVLSEVLQYIAANGDVTNNVGGSTSSNAGDSSQTCSTNAVEHDVTQVPEDRSARGDLAGGNNMSTAGNPAMVLGGVRNDANMSSIYLNQLIHEAITEDLCTTPFSGLEAAEKPAENENMFLFPDESRRKAEPGCNDDKESQEEAVTSHDASETVSTSAEQSSHPGSHKCHPSRAEKVLVNISPTESLEGGLDTMTTSEFLVIDSPFIRKNSFEEDCAILSLSRDELNYIENHFERPTNGKRDMLKPAPFLPDPVDRYHIQEFNVSWKLFGGLDFPGSSSYGRDKNNVVEISLRKIEVLYDRYRDVSLAEERCDNGALQGGCTVAGAGKYKSRLAFACDDIEILDRIYSSSINKMMYCYSAENCLRQAHAHMVLLKVLECWPTETNQLGSEFIVRLSILPIRLNFDQHTVFFLSDFFRSNNSNSPSSVSYHKSSNFEGASASGLGSSSPAKLPSKTSRVSFKSVESSSTDQQFVDLPPPSYTAATKKNSTGSQDRVAPRDNSGSPGSMKNHPSVLKKELPLRKSSYSEFDHKQAASTSFIKEFTFLSDVLIKFDYHGKYFDMDRGKLIGLLVGLAQIQCSHLVLRRLQANQGILGFDNLVLHCLTEWMNDIKRNQIPTLLGGIGPMYSLTQIMHGIVDLFWMPIEQYRRDGRIIKGFQRGAASFTTSSTSAALQLANRLISAIHFTAETAFDLLSPSARPCLPAPHSRHCAQPNDFREGLNMAYRTLCEGLNDTAATLVREAVDGRDSRGLTGAVGGVLRQIPPTLIAPVILASEATSTMIDGVSHQIAPDSRNEALRKWKY